MVDVVMRPALHSEHKELMKLTKLSKYTRDFSNRMFSASEMYERGWIQVAEAINDVPEGLASSFIGFYCIRHKTRVPATSLYFIGVDPVAKKRSIGTMLLGHLMLMSPHPRIDLNCSKDNTAAVKFYERHEFTIVGDSLGGAGYAMRKEWTR